MSETFSTRYAALVAAGKIEADPGQAVLGRRLTALEQRLDQHRLARKSSSLGWLFGEREQAGDAAQGPLHLWRGRPRQDDADGSVFRDQRRSAASAARISTNSWPTCMSAFTSSGRRSRTARPATTIRSARRRGDRRGNLAAVLRRIPRHRHRRRHDSRPAVHAAVRARRCRGRDLEPAAERALQGRAQPRAVPAFHRAARSATCEVVRLDARVDFRLEKLTGVPTWYVPADAKPTPRSTRPGGGWPAAMPARRMN